MILATSGVFRALVVANILLVVVSNSIVSLLLPRVLIQKTTCFWTRNSRKNLLDKAPNTLPKNLDTSNQMWGNVLFEASMSLAS